MNKITEEHALRYVREKYSEIKISEIKIEGEFVYAYGVLPPGMRQRFCACEVAEIEDSIKRPLYFGREQ